MGAILSSLSSTRGCETEGRRSTEVLYFKNKNYAELRLTGNVQSIKAAMKKLLTKSF